MSRTWKPPLRIRRAAEAFVVEAVGGEALAYVYVEVDERLRAQTRRVTVEEGREIARIIARALTEDIDRTKL
jgi:hypothetical protein